MTMTKLKSPRLVNHSDTSIGDLLDNPNADKSVLTARSYHNLVTKFNVSPEKARQFLGLQSIAQKGFDESEPRDTYGKWTVGGGGFGPSITHSSLGPAQRLAFTTALSPRSQKRIVAEALSDPADRAKYMEASDESDDLFNKGLTTKNKFTLPDGTYTPERQAIHEEILTKIFENYKNCEPKDGEKPTLVLLGGRGGSGKSNLDVQENP